MTHISLHERKVNETRKYSGQRIIEKGTTLRQGLIIKGNGFLDVDKTTRGLGRRGVEEVKNEPFPFR